MIIACPSCGASFNVKPEALGVSGRKVKCGKCGHDWHAAPQNSAAPVEAPAPAAEEPAPAQENPPLFDPTVEATSTPAGLDGDDDATATAAPSPAFDVPNDATSPEPDAADEPAFSIPPEPDAADEPAFSVPPEPDAADEPAFSIPPELDAADEPAFSIPPELDAADEPAFSVPPEPDAAEEPAGMEPPAPVEPTADNTAVDGFPPPPMAESNPLSAPEESAVVTSGRSRARMSLVPLLAVLLVLAVGAAGAIFMRPQIAEWIPASGTLYAAIGMQPESLGQGLSIVEPTPKKRIEGNDEILVVVGKIKNMSSKTRAVPLMRGALLDKNGKELHVWSFRARKTKIKSGETIDYRTEFRNPPPNAEKLDITFARRGEVKNGGAKKPAPKKSNEPQRKTGSK
jgi:predicted Zn finger-like uncharacterized protein